MTAPLTLCGPVNVAVSEIGVEMPVAARHAEDEVLLRPHEVLDRDEA